MEKFSFAPGIFFLILLAVAVVFYAAGALIQKGKDKPVRLHSEHENLPGHSRQFPHHTHPHDHK